MYIFIAKAGSSKLRNSCIYYYAPPALPSAFIHIGMKEAMYQNQYCAIMASSCLIN